MSSTEEDITMTVYSQKTFEEFTIDKRSTNGAMKTLSGCSKRQWLPFTKNGHSKSLLYIEYNQKSSIEADKAMTFYIQKNFKGLTVYKGRTKGPLKTLKMPTLERYATLKKYLHRRPSQIIIYSRPS